MGNKFIFNPIDSECASLVVHLYIDAYEEDECDFEIEYVETHDGMEFDLDELSSRDRKALELKAERVAMERCRDLYYDQQIDRVEDFID